MRIFRIQCSGGIKMKSKSKAAVKVTAVILSVAVLVAAILYAVPYIENKVCRNSNNPEKFEQLDEFC